MNNRYRLAISGTYFMLNLLKYSAFHLLAAGVFLTSYAACTSYGNSPDSGVDSEEHTNGDPGDYLNEIPELPEYCPDNLKNTHPPVVVDYCDASGILPKDAYEPTGDTFVTATWEGVRRLIEPYQLDCLENFITDPPGLPCSVDTVLDLRLQDNSSISFLLGVEEEDLADVPIGTLVEYSTTYRVWDLEPWDFGGISLVIRRPGDGVLILAAIGWDNLDYNDRHSFGSIAVEPRDDFVCYYMEYMNCKHYGVSPVSVIYGSDEHRVEPGESIVVPTSDGDYRVTLRRGKVRTCFEGESCCGDYEANRFSYSIVKLEQ
jgi:hypothetical protein